MKIKKIVLLSLIPLLVSCNGNNSTTPAEINTNNTFGNKKFAPEKKNGMSDDERIAAIEAKRNSLNVSPQELLSSKNEVKLSIIPPAPTEILSENDCNKIAKKMLSIILANGIGGMNNVPGFALASSLIEKDRKTTGTAPQKFVVTYDLFMDVINVVDGTIYGTTVENLTGVGNSFIDATSNAINSIVNNASISAMLKESSSKIIDWYENNLAEFKQQVNQSIQSQNYALAMALLQAVPSKAKKAFEYSNSLLPKVTDQFLKQNAELAFKSLKNAIAISGNEYSADVFAQFMLIPSSSVYYKQAKELIDKYERAVEATNKHKQTQAALKAEKDHIEALARIESEKQIGLAEAQASEKAMQLHLREQDYDRRGFWGSLGKSIMNILDE